MSTTKDDIRRWLADGKTKGATHLIVMTDTFSWDDYPTYVMPGTSARTEADKRAAGSMQRVTEVYALHLPWEAQLSEYRAFHYEAP